MHIEDQRVDTHLLEDQSDSRRAGVFRQTISITFFKYVGEVLVFVGNNMECVRNGATNNPILDRWWGSQVGIDLLRRMGN